MQERHIHRGVHSGTMAAPLDASATRTFTISLVIFSVFIPSAEAETWKRYYSPSCGSGESLTLSPQNGWACCSPVKVKGFNYKVETTGKFKYFAEISPSWGAGSHMRGSDCYVSNGGKTCKNKAGSQAGDPCYSAGNSIYINDCKRDACCWPDYINYYCLAVFCDESDGWFSGGEDCTWDSVSVTYDTVTSSSSTPSYTPRPSSYSTRSPPPTQSVQERLADAAANRAADAAAKNRAADTAASTAAKKTASKKSGKAARAAAAGGGVAAAVVGAFITCLCRSGGCSQDSSDNDKEADEEGEDVEPMTSDVEMQTFHPEVESITQQEMREPPPLPGYYPSGGGVIGVPVYTEVRDEYSQAQVSCLSARES